MPPISMGLSERMGLGKENASPLTVLNRSDAHTRKVYQEQLLLLDIARKRRKYLYSLDLNLCNFDCLCALKRQ